MRELLRPFEGRCRPNRYTPFLERLASAIDYQGDDACWEWRARRARGYGQITADGRIQYVHRVVYELLVGPIGEGLQIDHLCRNRACCNPRHLEPVTSRENTMRGLSFAAVNATKTECPAGHPYEGVNLIAGGGGRGCRACANERSRRFRARGRVA